MDSEGESLCRLIRALGAHEAALDALEAHYDACERSYSRISEEIDAEAAALGGATLSAHVNAEFGGAKRPRRQCSQAQVAQLMERIAALNREFDAVQRDGIQELIRDINSASAPSDAESQASAYLESEDEAILRKMGITI